VTAFLFYNGSLLDTAIRDVIQGSSEHRMYRF